MGADVDMQDPLSLDPTKRISLTPAEYLSTKNKSFQRKYPAYSALHAYHHPYEDSRDLGFIMGRGVRNMFDKSYPPVSQILNKGPLTAGLAGAVPGAALGVLGTGLLNLLSGSGLTENMGRNALLGALATAPLAAYSGYLRKYKPYAKAPGLHYPAYKQASVIKQAFGSQSEIVNALQNAPGLSFTERSQLIAGVSKLSSNDQDTLANLIAGVAGAAVGGLVAKYLMNRGLIGTVLGAIFGSVVSKAVFGTKAKTNFIGQPLFNPPPESELPINTSAIYSSMSL